MDLKFVQAANAYQNRADALRGVVEGAGIADDKVGQPSFSDMVSDALGQVSTTLHESEATKMQALTGQGVAELSDLVTAVANAELTVNTVVAVRDRVINAYQEIIRMPI